MSLRECTGCHVSKPPDAFFPDPRLSSGLTTRCRDCKNAYGRQWRQEHSAYMRAYDRARRETRRESARANYLAHQDERRGSRRERHRLAPEIAAAHTGRRRALIRAADCGCVTAEALRAIRDRQQDACYYCAERLGAVHWDHKTPLVRGGPHCLDNLAAACAACNLRKGRLTEAEFRAVSAA